MLILKDNADAPSGHFKLLVWRNGRLVETWEEKNIIVTGSKAVLAHLIGGDTTSKTISQIGFGTGTGAAAAGNSTLTSPFLKSFDTVSYPAAGQTQFNFSLASTEDNGVAISEFGLLTGDGTLFARKVRSAPLNKASDISLTGAWTVTF